MIVLWRKAGESIWIGGTKVKIDKATSGGRVRLAIDADDDVKILRDELKKPEMMKASK
jgi:carbon storage regulator CsrA